MRHIIFLDKITVPKDFKLHFDFPYILDEYENITKEELEKVIVDADIVITNKIALDANILKKATKLRLIAVCATGFNHIDIEAAASFGIVVCNVKGYSTVSVAEHAIMMMMSLMHRQPIHQQAIRDGFWQKSSFFSITTQPYKEIAGKTLTIIGKGDIGNAVAKTANALGMQVIFADRKNITDTRSGYLEFYQALKEADVISLHVPLTKDTANLIDDNALTYIKKDAVLINVSRGGLVDEHVVIKALKEDRLYGAAFDVASSEPPSNSNPLVANNNNLNLIVTPHIAWSSDNALANLNRILQNNINMFVKGEPVNVVNSSSR